MKGSRNDGMGRSCAGLIIMMGDSSGICKHEQYSGGCRDGLPIDSNVLSYSKDAVLLEFLLKRKLGALAPEN